MRRIGIMQPYFFPYLGYFSLIKHVDEFILLDTVQYMRHGWINRNRILKQNGGWLYIQAPLVHHSHKNPLNTIRVDTARHWKGRLLDQLVSYKRPSPHYRQVRSLVERSIDSEDDSLVALNRRTLQSVCDYLEIATPIRIFSDMHLEITTPEAPDEWALNICKALGDVDEYWNPPGGRSFFNPEKFARSGIELRFHEASLRPYDQRRETFEPGLSIIDVLMFNSPSTAREMLDDFSATT